jgi:hypothetical protein
MSSGGEGRAAFDDRHLVYMQAYMQAVSLEEATGMRSLCGGRSPSEGEGVIFED